MDPKAFDKLMTERHSARYFQKKPIPENVLKEIMTTSLKCPSWCNSQSWNAYVVSGETLEKIRKIWIQKFKDGVQRYTDIPSMHRTDNAERNAKYMEEIFVDIAKFLKDPEMKSFKDCQSFLFNAPTVVYLTLNKKCINYNFLDLGAFEMAICLAAKSHGVDSIIANACVLYPDVIRNNVKIPDDENIVMGIALGYEDDNILNKFRARKMDLNEGCHFFN